MSKKRLLILLSVCIVPLILSACGDGGDSSEEAAALPTLFELPTLTPTNTPTATFTPSITPTPTSTSTPTSTATPTNTPTPTSTHTPTNTFTPLPTATATPVPFTDTPAPTATPTLTATLPVTATPIQPQIINFNANQTTASGGSTVTLSWTTTNAASAVIEQLSVNNALMQSFPVPVSGTQAVTIPSTGSQVIYRLVALRDNLSASRSIPITITLACPVDWFFGNALVPPGTGCPSGPPQPLPASLQRFERGFMLNFTLGENRVYGFNNVNRLYRREVSGWDGSTVYASACDSAAAPLLAPQGVFNWFHTQRTNTTGSTGWAGPNSIGCATTALDPNVTVTIQSASNGPTYILVSGAIGLIRLTGGPAVEAGSWAPVQ